MKIEADDKEVQDIFSLGYFKIPRFQRPYSWELDEVESFWNDIVSEGENNYFIGSMVVYQTKRPYFGIVDGQQRLTTITLLLSAIRNGFLALGEKNLALGVHKYIEKANIDNEKEFIITSETAFPYLQSHIQNYDGYTIDCEVGTEEKKLKRAFELLAENLSSLIPEIKEVEAVQRSLFANDTSNPVSKLKLLRDKILSLKLVFIQLDNEEDAYLIFETLNARGRDLTTADLIKNLVLKKLKSKSAALDSAKESWNQLVKRFDGSSDDSIFDSFLLHFWLSKYNYVTDKKLFSEVKLVIEKNPSKAEEIIQELTDSSTLYTYIVDPASVQWTQQEAPVKDCLVSLRSFKVKQQSAMVLSLLRAWKNKTISLKNLRRALNKIVCFHYAFNSITSQRSSGTISSTYSKIAINLSNAKNDSDIQKSFNELDDFLKGKFPALEEFLVKFVELEYLGNRAKHKNSIVYALRLIMIKENNGLPINYDGCSIEHLFPQSYSEYDEDFIGSIGNLVLVDSSINSEKLRDNEPMVKIEMLKSMGFPIEDTFLNVIEFDQISIMDRAKKIAEAVYFHLHQIIHE